ncbi:MAG: hypothetical protein JRJ73_03270 [Deltaproteobacteria bacterium]|nr:hypothetical protein [Deltaproteobacteria bacterium]
MKVECQNCKVKINLPDDKLMPGEDFAFTCPKCKTRNSISIPANGKEAELSPAESDLASPPLETEKPSKPDLEFDEEDEAAIGEFYEEGAKLALICFDEGPQRDKLVEITTSLGYVPVLPASTRDALRRIKVTLHHAILLHENFDGHLDGFHPILLTIQPMIMSTRRRIFMALFGEEYHSLDHMSAFQLSVNAVIALSDEQRFDKIIHKALAEYERFYKAYFEVAREQGRS